MELKITFLMHHILILKVAKFQPPTPKRFSTVVKNILGLNLNALIISLNVSNYNSRKSNLNDIISVKNLWHVFHFQPTVGLKF